MRWLVGGPAYRMEMRCEHGAMLFQLGAFLGRRGEQSTIRYRHTSILPEGRAHFLRGAVDDGYDVALGVDSDTWIKDVSALLELVDIALAADTAMLGVLVPQRDGRVNGWADEGLRFTVDDVPPLEVVDAWAVGAALCLYNLAWYRRHAPDVAHTYAVVPTPDGAFLGEDVWHCRAVARAGGRIRAVRLPGVRHGAGL